VDIARQSSDVARPAPRDISLPCQALPPIAAALDVGLLVLASVAGEIGYQYCTTNAFASLDGAVGIGLVSAVLFVLSARVEGLYRLQALLAPGSNLGRITVTLAVSHLAVICTLFLLKIGAEYSRGAMIAFSAFAFCLEPVGRLLFGAAARSGVRRGAIKGRRVVTLGDAFELERLGEADFLQFGMEEIARIALRGDSRASAGRLGERDRARIAQAIQASRDYQALEFALIMPWSGDGVLSEVCGLLRVSPLPVRLYPDQKIRNVLRHQKERGFGRHFSVTIQREPLSGSERALKRALDIIIAATALVALTPFLLLVSLAIKLDSRGPVIFRQRRCGFDNREFVMFKFRTMTVLEDSGPIVQARRADDRVTRVGRILRRTSVDELPQLLNVVQGDMSLVGPRPHALAHDDEYKARIDNYALRHHVKPGLTGAAQVQGLRGETRRLSQMEQRVERDLWYINNWSLTLDFKIMAMTCVALLRPEAY
jgi:undecaprenyl-phosphate galactose phosphotransferase/putative colanic acid biosynthesis UDP-glucose lipid carrier transferase